MGPFDNTMRDPFAPEAVTPPSRPATLPMSDSSEYFASLDTDEGPPEEPPQPGLSPPTTDVIQTPPQGRQNKQTTIQQKVITPEAKTAIESGFKNELELVDEAGVLAQSELREREQAAREKRDYDDSQRAKRDQAVQVYQNDLSAKYGDYEKSVEALSQSKDFFANKTTGDKILAGLAIALGAVSEGMGGGDNPGLKVINAAVERDIDMAKSQMMANKGVLSELRDKFKDERLAEVVLRESMYTKIESDMDARIAALSGGNQAQKQMANKLAQAKVPITAKFDEFRAEADSYIQTSVVVPQATRPVEKLSAPEVVKLDTHKNVLRAMDELEMMVQTDVEVGGIMNEKAKKFMVQMGVASSKDTVFNKAMQDAFQKKIVALTGAAAPTAQMDSIEATLPRWRDNKDVFLAMVQAERSNAQMAYEDARTTAGNANIAAYPPYKFMAFSNQYGNNSAKAKEANRGRK